MAKKNSIFTKLADNITGFFDTKVKKVWGVIISAAVVVLLFVLLFSSLSGNGTVVLNEHFESFRSSGYSEDAYRAGTSVFTAPAAGEGVGGGKCLKIENPSLNDARLTKKITLKEGSIYRIQADVKADAEGYTKAANVSILEARDDYKFVSGGDWTHIDQYVKVGKTDDYTLCLRLGYFGAEAAGTAWFDNVSVTQVSGTPAGAKVISVGKTTSSSSVTEGAEYNEATYHNMRIVSWLILSVIFFILLVYGLYIRFYDKMGAEYIPGNETVRFFPARYDVGGNAPFKTLANPAVAFAVILTVALILRIVLSVTYYECSIDVELFKSWGRTAAEKGMSQLYVVATNCDYPPLYMYVLAFMTHIGNFLKLGSTGMTLLAKLPSMLADIGIGFIVYFAAIKKRYSFGSAMFFASIWLFNPVALVDSACWGQVDSILALFVILCCIAVNGKKYLAAGLFFGFGTMLKPQMIIFVPVLGCIFFIDFVAEWVRGRPKKSFIHLGKLAGGLFTGLFVPCLPYFNMGTAELSLFGKAVKLPWIFSLFLGTVDHYSYATVNNYNFWFLLGKNWVRDEKMMGSLSLHTWGMLAIVAISLTVVCVLLAEAFTRLYRERKPKGKGKAKNAGSGESRLLHPGLIFLAGAVMFSMVSSFGPRMHERYFFPAVPLLLLAALCYHRKGTLGAYGLMSGIGFITVHEIMMGLLVGGSIKKVNNDTSVYGDYYWPGLDNYRGFLAAVTVAAALVAFGMFIGHKYIEKKEFDYELK